MKKIAYCYDKRSKRKNSLPFPVVKITNILQVYNDDYPCIIFDYDFLKRRPKLDIDKLTNKICCIRFAQEHSSNISIVRKYGFFDFFTDNETKAKILFKIGRLKRSIESVSKIDLLNKRIDKLILVDHLTGCYNWRYFLNRAKQELSRALRHHYNISFIIIDIDYFRQINEIYGTKVADMVIKHLVVILQKLLRKEDILTRWREDEFFVTLPYLAKADAYKVATRIKSKVSAYTFCYKNISMKIKVSLGVTSAPSDKISNTGDVISI
ncbi:MAG: GGDEF domain-containing protein [Candidatus Omnitrophica bacterium]|nr:GGDEF domain-containing protein [Candidatus Omnitrophota bacterium]